MVVTRSKAWHLQLASSKGPFTHKDVVYRCVLNYVVEQIYAGNLSLRSHYHFFGVDHGCRRTLRCSALLGRHRDLLRTEMLLSGVIRKAQYTLKFQDQNYTFDLTSDECLGEITHGNVFLASSTSQFPTLLWQTF